MEERIPGKKKEMGGVLTSGKGGWGHVGYLLCRTESEHRRTAKKGQQRDDPGR